MNRLLSRGDLKVDAMSMQMENSAYLILYNVNVPANLLEDQVQKRASFERVAELLASDFERNDVQYQITASYILKHKETGAERFWSGSFFAKEDSPAVLLDFQRFNRLNFVDTALAATQNVNDKLAWRGRETVWAFSQLESLIFNAESKVRANCSIFEKRGIVRRLKKNRVTFAIE